MIRRWFERARDPRRSISADAIVWAYRLFLDREPESEATVEQLARALPNTTAIRRQFMGSREYREHIGTGVRPSLAGTEPPMHIEDVDDPLEVARLLDHIAKTWTEFGETEPHYSVITDEKFKPTRIDETLDAFNASGKDGVTRFDAALARAGVDQRNEATCLELGCGVGRVTAWLARRCARVIGTDISAAHLAIARKHLETEGLKNVELHRLLSVDTLAALPRFDLFFSVIVLQHNPPPVIRAILDRTFERLLPGGIAYFQVPTYRSGYAFRLETYLREDLSKNAMEMHVLPQSAIMRLASKHGLDLLEVIEDPYTGMRLGEISNTFLFRKRDST